MGYVEPAQLGKTFEVRGVDVCQKGLVRGADRQVGGAIENPIRRDVLPLNSEKIEHALEGFPVVLRQVILAEHQNLAAWEDGQEALHLSAVKAALHIGIVPPRIIGSGGRKAAPLCPDGAGKVEGLPAVRPAHAPVGMGSRHRIAEQRDDPDIGIMQPQPLKRVRPPDVGGRRLAPDHAPSSG